MRNWIVGCAAGALLVAGMTMAPGLMAQDKGKPGDAAKGKAVFEQCSGCHATDTDDVIVGPSLKGLFKRKMLKDGKPVNEANVREMINMGGNGMPSFSDSLSDQDKNDVIAYLKTL
jgi:cytochrome c2